MQKRKRYARLPQASSSSVSCCKIVHMDPAVTIGAAIRSRHRFMPPGTRAVMEEALCRCTGKDYFAAQIVLRWLGETREREGHGRHRQDTSGVRTAP